MAAPGGSREPLITELKEAWDYDTTEWREIRQEGSKDMRCVAGDPWDEEDRKAREDAGRVCLSLDELGQYVNQTINEVRQHKRAIQVTPMGFGANDDTARLRADLIRQIEYRSNAQIAYTTMFENTVQRSYGFLRIKAKYLSERSHDQELLIEPLVNPDLVTMDADAVKPDGSDMKRAFIYESWSIRDYKRRFPKARVQSFDSEEARFAPSNWVYNDQRIQIAEWWRVTSKPRRLLRVLLADGRPFDLFEDELADPKYAALLPTGKALTVQKERTVEYPVVEHYLTNGLEILDADEEHVWPGMAIPLVFCPGKVLYVDDGGGAERKILSLIRLARDPFMLYCYTRTCQYELVGMTPKVPYFVRKGSLDADNLLRLQKSLHEPVAVVEVDALVDGLPPGQMAEFPMRNPYEPQVQQLEMLAEASRRAIQAAMGISPLPTAAQRRNEKSGIALQEMRNAEQQGSYHFIDHYEMAITRSGVLLDDLLPHYYDSVRDVTLRDKTDATRVVRINDPTTPDEQTGQPLMIGDEAHDVTLSTGPAMDSEREAASAFADALLNTPFANVVADLAVRLKNVGPIGDEIADRLKALLPPQVQQAEQAKHADPAQLMQQLQQAQQMIQMLTQELQAKTQAVETDQAKQQASMSIAQLKEQMETMREQMRLQTDVTLKRRELEAKLEIEMAKLGSAESMKRAEIEQEQLHQHGEVLMRQQEMEAESAQADLDRQAARDAQAQDRAFQASEAERTRQADAARPR